MLGGAEAVAAAVASACPAVIVLLLRQRRKECGELGVLWLICRKALMAGWMSAPLVALVKSPQLAVVVGTPPAVLSSPPLASGCSSPQTMDTRRALRLAASSSCQKNKNQTCT